MPQPDPSAGRSGPNHLLSVCDLSPDEVRRILHRADDLRRGVQPPAPGRRRAIGLMFLETSTRTRLGFAAAAARLGWDAATLDAPRREAGMSGAEELSDAVRSVSAWFDVIVLRHPDGARAAAAARASECPVISGGFGRIEHPSQALIDVFAITRALGRVEGVRVAMVGDLAWSRSARSMVLLLDRLGAAPTTVLHPDGAGFPAEVTSRLGAPVRRADGFGDLADSDVVYVAGLPAATADCVWPDAARAEYRVSSSVLDRLPHQAVVLCPLPRIDEIARDVDENPRAWYFRSSAESVHVRTALLEMWSAGRACAPTS